MPKTKRHFISKALAKIGLGDVAYDADAEDLQDALSELNAMMAEWAERGIDIEWPLSDTQDIETVTEAAAGEETAIIYNLAQRIAPDFGKAVAPRVDAIALRQFNRLMRAYNPTPLKQKTRRLSGAGNRRGYGGRVFIPSTESDDVCE